MNEAFGRLVAASDDERRDVFLTTARRLGTARRHCSRARRLSVEQHPAKIDFLREYRRLAALFTVEVTTFERKRYTNLSHEPNKAMNLNSCISLMGRSFREVESERGRVLEECDNALASVRVPTIDFIIILDADSLILSDYSRRLLHFMTQPGHERVAVVQTKHALLCLELKWIEGAGLDAARLSADKLRAHVELLREQASELEAECYQLRFHPRYAPLIVDGPLGVPVLVDGPREAAKLDAVIESLRIDVERLASDEAITIIRETLHAYREPRQAEARAAHRRRILAY